MFCWFVLQDCLKTWDNLSLLGWIGPSRCILCKRSSESATHLFVDCSFTRDLWEKFYQNFGIFVKWNGPNVESCLQDWLKNCKEHLTLPIFICWTVWTLRNKATFEEQTPNVDGIYNVVLSHYLHYQTGLKPPVHRNVGNFQFIVNDPVLFFDGVANLGNCGAGGVIFINEFHYFSLRLKCGRGSNMKAELLALWCVSRVANLFGLVNVKIFGDSRATIKWARGEFDLNVLNSVHWSYRVKEELSTFRSVTLEHIFREFNEQADQLSKLALEGEEDFLYWDEFF